MGEPAFPSPNQVTLGDYSTGGHIGMTLRDWFAGQAISGCIAQAFSEEGPSSSALEVFDKAALWAYDIADAMLAARKATPDA